MIDFIKLAQAQRCYFRKGEFILRQNELVEYVYYLAEGVVYRTILDENGDITIYDVKYANEGLDSVLGVLFLFPQGICYNDFVAKTDCTCYKISKNRILAEIKEDAEILYGLLGLLSEQYNETIELLQEKKQKCTVKRLCMFLLNHSAYTDGQLLLDKVYTNAEIARFLGIHAVTAARIIKCLKDEVAVKKTSKGMLILNQELLQEYISGKRKMVYS